MTATTFTRKMLPELVLRSIRYWRRQLPLRPFADRVISRQYHGDAVQLHLSEPTAEAWYDHDWGILPELTLLGASKLGPGATVFDLGGHQGLLAIILSRMVAGGGHVVAVEPVKGNAAVAELNLELNRVANVTVVHAAAAATAGKCQVVQRSNGVVCRGQSAERLAMVPSVTVDGLADRYGMPAVLFIDVEGLELEVLQGASCTLATQPDCFVEVHVGCGLELFGATAQSVLAYFPPHQYDCWISGGPGYERPHCREYAFVPYTADSPILGKRFFLVAIAKSNSAELTRRTNADQLEAANLRETGAGSGSQQP